MNAPARQHVFIAGIPRSGTTLLRLVLSAHPQVAISPETHCLERIMFGFPHTGRLDDEHLGQLKQVIGEDRKLAGWKIDLQPYLERVSDYTEITTRQAIRDLMEHYRDQTAPHATVLGNKKGFFAEYGELAHHLFPEAKFLFIVRDARDAVYSMKTNLKGYSAISASIRWRARVVRGRRLQARYPAQCLLIKYEDLVSEPETVCRILCAFLQIEYAPEMIRFYEGNQRHERVIEGTEQIHQLTSSPFTKDRIGRWRKGLTAGEVRIVQTIAGRELGRLGYEVDRRRSWNPRMLATCWVAGVLDDVRWWRNLCRAKARIG
jgi:hypothetical protein